VRARRCCSLMLHFHGETEMPRSHRDPTGAFVDIPESLHEGAFNIATTRKAADSGNSRAVFRCVGSSLTRGIAPATKPRTHQSTCMPAGVPSDQFGAATRNTSIDGNPFACGCSEGAMNQYGLDMTGDPAAPAPQSLPSLTRV